MSLRESHKMKCVSKTFSSPQFFRTKMKSFLYAGENGNLRKQLREREKFKIEVISDYRMWMRELKILFITWKIHFLTFQKSNCHHHRWFCDVFCWSWKKNLRLLLISDIKNFNFQSKSNNTEISTREVELKCLLTYNSDNNKQLKI